MSVTYAKSKAKAMHRKENVMFSDVAQAAIKSKPKPVRSPAMK